MCAENAVIICSDFNNARYTSPRKNGINSALTRSIKKAQTSDTMIKAKWEAPETLRSARLEVSVA
jgi:hypothetical protein